MFRYTKSRRSKLVVGRNMMAKVKEFTITIMYRINKTSFHKILPKHVLKIAHTILKPCLIYMLIDNERNICLFIEIKFMQSSDV